MAKDGQEEAWRNIYPSIFCADEADPDLKRQPGLLKVCVNISFRVLKIISDRISDCEWQPVLLVTKMLQSIL